LYFHLDAIVNHPNLYVRDALQKHIHHQGKGHHFPRFKTCLLKEVFYLSPIGQSPFTAEAGALPKKAPPRFTGIGIHHIIRINDAPAAK
jgi:hypothetical protein